MKEIRIAHFMFDQKFNDSAYKQFETVFPGQNSYFIPSFDKELKFTREIPVDFISPFSLFSQKFIQDIAGFDLIIIHSLKPFTRRLIANISKLDMKPKIVWVGMGYDYSELLYDHDQTLYLQKTLKLVAKSSLKTKLKQSKDKIFNFDANFIYKIYRIFAKRSVATKTLLKSIDFFAPVIPLEYSTIQHRLSSCDFFPRYVSWNYAMNSLLVESDKAYETKKKLDDILLGNSATPSNNHLEILDFLGEHQNSFKQVILPLNYGNERYAEKVIDYGSTLLEEKFYGITEFMKYEEYIKQITTCKVAIMNHIRQQAVGNIIIMLHAGATVFLRKESLLYDFYHSKGLILFTVQELQNSPELLAYKLTKEEVHHNREVLKSLYGWQVNLQKTKKLIEVALKDVDRAELK